MSTQINVSKGGPYKVKGNFKITGIDQADITPADKDTVYLCACGKSKNKPFCDGTHANDLNKE